MSNARILIGPGLELFLALAALVQDAAEPESEIARRALAQARRKLDQGFRRRFVALSAAPDFWLGLAALAGADGLAAEDAAGVIDALASAPQERFETLASQAGEDPASVQAAVADVLRRFDRLVFAALWRQLRDALADDAAALESRLRNTDRVALFDALGIESAVAKGRELILLPSAFAPRGFRIVSDGILAVPVVVQRLEGLSPLVALVPRPRIDRAPDPAAAFSALGDATRYAIASLIARTPMTGAELARRLDASAPTMTHHLRRLRQAGLLLEQRSGNRISLSLDRAAIAALSEAALSQLFGAGETIIRRSRRRRD